MDKASHLIGDRGTAHKIRYSLLTHAFIGLLATKKTHPVNSPNKHPFDIFSLFALNASILRLDFSNSAYNFCFNAFEEGKKIGSQFSFASEDLRVKKPSRDYFDKLIKWGIHSSSLT